MHSFSNFINESKELDITERELKKNLLGVSNLIKKGDQIKFDFEIGEENRGYVNYDPETGLKITIGDETWQYQKSVNDKKTFFDAFDFEDEKNWVQIN